MPILHLVRAGDATKSLDHKATFRGVLEALRPEAWVKNLLVFTPLMVTHRSLETSQIINTFLMFAALCLCASSLYLINDIRDIDADRQHSVKHARAFANDTLPQWLAYIGSPLLLLASLLTAKLIATEASAMIMGSFLLGSGYTLFLKPFALVDVIALSGLTTMRILCGVVATGLGISLWSLSFSMFFFLSLALVKLHTEILQLPLGSHRVPGRGYRATDEDFVALLGMCAAMVAVGIMSIFICRSQYVAPTPNGGSAMLLFVFPILMLFWMSRLWLLSYRQELPSDPVAFATKDPTSYLTFVLLIEALVLRKVFFL